MGVVYFSDSQFLSAFEFLQLLFPLLRHLFLPFLFDEFLPLLRPLLDGGFGQMLRLIKVDL